MIKTKRSRKLRQDAGFTLVELLVVLGILSMMAGFAYPQYLKWRGKANTDAARIQISAITNALELFALENGGYPTEEMGLGALMQAPGGLPRWGGPYLKKAEGLNDPWGRPYRYKVLGPGQISVFTLGRDNAPGGTGEDQDVAN